MSWWARRKPQGFNLAFLDIMSCGLGAIILIFMLVKYQADEPGVEAGALEAKLADIQAQTREMAAANSALSARIDALKSELQQAAQRAAQATDARAAAAEELIRLTKEISRLEQQLARQQQAAAETTEPTDDILRQDHLIGLRVSGERIVILLDNSASMADERLVDIIKVKAAGVAAQKAAPKWQRALAVARWMIERVPEDSEYRVARYNDTAAFVPDAQWLSGGDENAREAAMKALQELHPHNATNLNAALKLIASASPSPTDVYVITDSLPTKGFDRLSALQRRKACGSFTAKATTVSGECREALFWAAVQPFARVPATVNTVLLPIEGDPEASYAYWLWAASTTGMMLSPAGEWP